ncbi:MAG: hypothetical protein CEN91_248 [Candidatus Berkelbacteria bacterium Licking1014_85]|uniref:Polymerase beta nucleotidyltransferase domain-containing protein n=1 Tax=Candidatus Berkelbacteria bacterium Licking1014_85 TaxID=2017148 RepID=A0A554LKB9_9BACT|nr:MAG: hypothetical protein CEN91_248 [Candidatus Berkelbacteria bacterium Licking1014_85]
MQKNFVNSELYNQRFRQTQRIVKILSRFPFVNMIALTGSMITGKITEKSDIDLFIQAEKGRLYLCRFLTTGFVWLIGKKRTNKKIAGKFCLNWYATFNGPKKNNIPHVVLYRRNKITDFPPRGWKIGYKILNALENIVKKYQIHRFKNDPRTYLPGSRVRWSDTEIGLHPPK